MTSNARLRTRSASSRRSAVFGLAANYLFTLFQTGQHAHFLSSWFKWLSSAFSADFVENINNSLLKIDPGFEFPTLNYFWSSFWDNYLSYFRIGLRPISEVRTYNLCLLDSSLREREYLWNYSAWIVKMKEILFLPILNNLFDHDEFIIGVSTRRSLICWNKEEDQVTFGLFSVITIFKCLLLE